MKKRKVLVVLHHYLPGDRSGGPVRSLANMVTALSNDVDFYIYTLNRDWLASAPYSGIVSRSWTPVGCARVYYDSPYSYGICRLIYLIRTINPDIVYFNSFFTPIFGLWVVRSLFCSLPKTILAPRGQFGMGALRLKWYKKYLFLAVIKPMINLNRGSFLYHASSSLEAREIRQILQVKNLFYTPKELGNVVVAEPLVGGQRIAVASDLGAHEQGVPPAERPKKVTGVARLVFCSRISQKKNLAWLLPLLAEVKGKVLLDVFGEFDDRSYEAECRLALRKCGSAVVNFCGHISHDQVHVVLSSYDVMVLPTLNENFGHIVGEALGAGCPVLISDQTPWRPQEKGAGWSVSLNDSRQWIRVIQALVDMPHDAHAEMIDAALLFRTASDDLADIEANRRLFFG